jgi:hypothetical protein
MDYTDCTDKTSFNFYFNGILLVMVYMKIYIFFIKSSTLKNVWIILNQFDFTKML